MLKELIKQWVEMIFLDFLFSLEWTVLTLKIHGIECGHAGILKTNMDKELKLLLKTNLET